jgi:hypothetical protein
MYEFNRFSVQVIGTVDDIDSVELHQQIKTALLGVDKFKVKAISLDEWVDGYSGKTRKFDENGDEIVEQPPAQYQEETIEEIEVLG